MLTLLPFCLTWAAFCADPRRQHEAVGTGLNELAFRGCSFSRAMMVSSQLRLRALSVMNTFAASSGKTVRSALAREIPASRRMASSVASPQAEEPNRLKQSSGELLQPVR